MSSKVDPNAPVVRKDLDEAVSTILEGIDNMFKDQNDSLNKKFSSIDQRFDNVDTKIDNVEKHLKDDIKGLKADLSDTVFRKEFNQLKTRVNKYHPAN